MPEALDNYMLTMARIVVTYPVVFYTVKNPPSVLPFPFKTSNYQGIMIITYPIREVGEKVMERSIYMNSNAKWDCCYIRNI